MKRSYFVLLIIVSLWVCAGQACAQDPPPWYPCEPQSVKNIQNDVHAPDMEMQEPPADPEPWEPPAELESWKPPQDQGPSGDPGPRGGGEVNGKVVLRDSSGNPDESKGISGAVVKVYQGNRFRTCVSGHDGSFVLRDVSPGENLMSITARGFREASGRVKVTENSTRNVLVGLSSLWGRSADNGYINIYAYGHEDYEGNRIGVESIRVHQVGDYSHRWYNSWNPGYGYTYQSLSCSRAPVGKYYRIVVVWGDGSVRTRDIYLSNKYRDVSIYHW